MQLCVTSVLHVCKVQTTIVVISLTLLPKFKLVLKAFVISIFGDLVSKA